MHLGKSLLTIGALSLALAAGCSDDTSEKPGTDGGTRDTGIARDNGSTNDTGNTNDTGITPQGKASLSFTPTWGKNGGTQLESLWRPSLPYYEADSALVLMLCKTDDASCQSPVLVKELDATTRTDKPIQNSFGPAITVNDLPAGSYKLMIVADGTTSRAKGFAWNSGFETKETAWKGVVSEGDMMLSSKTPTNGDNPAPEPLDLTLEDDKTSELGTLTLSHLHERDISPNVPKENGAMVVAVEKGVRFVDLATYQVSEVAAGSGVYTHQLVDSTDKALEGVCGMVQGTGDTIYLLYKGGYAYAFDTKTRQQLSKNAITFDQAAGATPCKGVLLSKGGSDFLYVLNSGASSVGPANEGLWYADVTNLATGAVTATYLNKSADPILSLGFGDLVAHGDALYASQLTPDTATAGPAACKGQICVFRFTVGAAGKPEFKPITPNPDYDVSPVMAPKASYDNAQGTLNCLTSGDINRAGLGVATFQGTGALKGHDLLFVGGCLQIKVLDLSDGRKELDFDSVRAGAQGFDATVFGQNFASFQLAPNGKTLWAFPAYKALIHFDILVSTPGDAQHRQTFNRMMALPISLVGADRPTVDPDFAAGNIDGHEGPLSLGSYKAPADDPGVDLNHGHFVVYQMSWAPSTAGATFQSASIPTGPTFAVTPKALWMRGSGISGVSGLGKGGNLGVYDLASRRAVLFSHAGDDFYPYFQMGPGGDDEARFFGFDLTPEGASQLATYGLLYRAE